MRLRTIIVDDEAPARERLRRFLQRNDAVELVGEAEDGKAAVEMIEAGRPDLVLLDIQMPGLDGFGVIKALAEPPLIVFVTAYDEYAIQAFEANALDYLLKPFTAQRLDRAVDKALQEASRKAEFTARIDALLQTLNRQKRHLERVAVRNGATILVVPVADIEWIGADEGAVYIHTAGGHYQSNYTMEEFDARLNPRTFFRTHRATIVNLSRIKEIVPWFAGSYRVRLSSGVELDVSRDRVKGLRQIIDW